MTSRPGSGKIMTKRTRNLRGAVNLLMLTHIVATITALVLLRHPYGLIALFLSFVCGLAWTSMFNCPNCGLNVFERVISKRYAGVYLMVPWAPAKCSQCGMDFTAIKK
jgi:hypothetical protein